MEEAEYTRLSRRMKNLVGPYAKGYIAGLDRAYLNQREFKLKHPDVPQHKYCMRKKDAWGEGYKHGFDGLEPSPPRGAPKSQNPTKTHTIRVRVTDAQFERYNSLGANEWILKALSEEENHESNHEAQVTEAEPAPGGKKSTRSKRSKQIQAELPIDPGDCLGDSGCGPAPNHVRDNVAFMDGALNAA